MLLLFVVLTQGLLLPPERPEGVSVLWDGERVHLVLAFSDAFFPGISPQGIPMEIAFQGSGFRPSAGFLNERLVPGPDGWIRHDLTLPIKPTDSVMHLRLTLYDRAHNRTFLSLDRNLVATPLAVVPLDSEGSPGLPVFTTQDSLRFRIRSPRPGTLQVTIRQGKKRTVVFQQSLPVDTVSTLTLPASRFADGEYELSVVHGEDEQAISFRMWGLRGLSDRTWKDILFLLQLAFPDSTFQGFMELPPEGRQARFWEAWRTTDPNPTTPFLEHYAQFRRKIREVNERFGVGNLPGYRTHQGLVFLKYGPPDWVERRPFEINARPSEVWIYEHAPRRMIFVFVDRQGTGVYTLVESDPPGLFP